MTKRLCLSLALAVMAVLLIAVPVFASFYAYIYVEESDGNSYEELPLICPCNITALAESGFISSTGLDTRVLTGDAATLPHMLTEDKIMFVSDLAAHEEKTLIFYPGATSLSSFPIITGYGGYVTTPDDSDLELTYVIELLISGYFDTSAGSDKNILYKEEAFRVWIAAANTLRVAGLEAGGGEQWYLQDSSFSSGEHTVYVMANGLAAYLYVDDFELPVDSVALYGETSQQINNANDPLLSWGGHRTFYAEGRYWAIWMESATDNYFHYRTSTDGDSWAAEQTFALYNSGDRAESFCVWFDGDYFHIAYGHYESGDDDWRYRRGDPEASGNITWSAAWQVIEGEGNTFASSAEIVVDDNGYPMVVYWNRAVLADHLKIYKSSANDGTWTTAGGYPVELYQYQPVSLGVCHDSSEMYLLANHESDDTKLYGKYYNGNSWDGSFTTLDNVAGTGSIVMSGGVVGDDDGNFYFVWTINHGTHYSVRLRVRYSGGSFSNEITLAGSVGHNARYPNLTYNPENDMVYIFYNIDDKIHVRTLLDNELSAEYELFSQDNESGFVVAPKASHIGILASASSALLYGVLDLTAFEWNDNSNNWTWMQNNVMPYADYLIMAVDGTTHLHYQPEAIIQGTTLPDISEASGNDGIITWGTNPDGVDVSHSELICETEDEEGTGYYYFEPGSQDIIGPEPETMIGDVDLERLHDNPLYPLVQILSIDGFLNERLIWLGLAWLIVIVAMLGVHLGFDTRPNTEKPQHFILTTVTGLGLSILFYTMGIFPLWVIILMAFGLGGAIIWERQPVL